MAVQVITVAMVRDDVLDRVPEDHLVLADLAFKDPDIEWAMQWCARKFNSLKPIGIYVEWDKLPATTTVFFDGIALALIRRWHRNVAMNDYGYNAGGVTANVQGDLKQNLEKLRDKLEQDFVSAATDLKISSNLDDAYGVIG
jgi:hypothetical protein